MMSKAWQVLLILSLVLLITACGVPPASPNEPVPAEQKAKEPAPVAPPATPAPSSSPAAPATSAATPASGTGPEELGKIYLQYVALAQYDKAYELLTTAGQKQYSLAVFTKHAQDFREFSGLGSLKANEVSGIIIQPGQDLSYIDPEFSNVIMYTHQSKNWIKRGVTLIKDPASGEWRVMLTGVQS